MKSLSDAFEHTLKDLYYAENAVVKALQEAAGAATHKDLKDALKHHSDETAQDVEFLRDVFKTIDIKPEGEKCDAIEGLIKECKGVIEEATGPTAKNASILACCQAIEHYEIARAGTLREWAKTLGNADGHALLTQILDDHKGANHTLSHLAITEINRTKVERAR